MRDVFLADPRDPGVGVEIEIALRQSQSTLTEMSGLHIGFLLVLIDVKAEERSHLQRALGECDIHHIARRLDRVDPPELDVERMNPLLLDLRRVHRRRPEISDLLRVASRRGRGCRGLLVDLPQVHI